MGGDKNFFFHHFLKTPIFRFAKHKTLHYFRIGRYSVFLILTGCWAGCCSGLFAQSPGLPQERTLEQAIHLLNSNKNDSALILLQPVLDQLAASDLTDSPFGLKVQLAKGQALEQAHHHRDAISLYNELKEKCEATGQWETYAGTCLSMARLYEKMYRPARAKENLKSARSTIAQHHLDSLYPDLLIQDAFWHQSFDGNPDSVRHYSEKAIKAVNVSDNPILNYSLLMLRGGLLYYNDDLGAVEIYKEAAEIAISLGDYVRLSDSWKNMTHVYGWNGDYKNAFIYNDSTIMACYQAIAEGHERIYTLGYAYRTRGHLFEIMGQVDSALFYTKRGFAQELKFLEQRELDRVAEVDARYRDGQKTQQIADQAEVISFEKKIRKLLLLIFIITFLLAAGFLIGLVKHRRGERRLSEQNKIIQQQSEQLKSLDAAKSRFFANVSHELRTPLTLLLGPINTLLKEEKLTGKQTELLRLAKQGSKRLQLLVNEILDLGKLESGKMTVIAEPVNLAAFFRHYFSQFESLGVQNGVAFGFDILVPGHLTAMLDKEKCRQIVYNLLSNAFKFTQPGGSVKAVVKMEANELLLEVSDTGEGIHPDDLPHVFDQYFQTSRPDAPVMGGTGIGLALCQEYVRLFGGSITVESILGKGTKFIVRFPVETVEGHVPEEGHSKELAFGFKDVKEKPDRLTLPAPNTPTGTDGEWLPTILVVEDNVELQAYLRLVLEGKYHVFTAKNGQVALELLRDEEGGMRDDIRDEERGMRDEGMDLPEMT